jgi:hypothetical protein
MGQDGRGVTSMTQHMAEPGPGVKGWDISLMIDCTPVQHAHLQELIMARLSRDCTEPRLELGQGIALKSASRRGTSASNRASVAKNCS